MTYFDDISRAIGANLATLRATGALAARPGRLLDADGYPLAQRVVVLLAAPHARLHHIPLEIGGFAVDVRRATPAQVVQFTDPVAFRARAARSRGEYVPTEFPGQVALQALPDATPDITTLVPYTPPPNADYSPLPAAKIRMICSVSPDNGWDVLQAFLAGTKTSLTTAMYDFTSAHIAQAAASALAGKSFELVLDHPSKNPTADQTDAQTVAQLQGDIGASFAQTWALTPSDPDRGAPIFPSAYHIKVAVRDAASPDNVAVWLSSGNWNNSNQPIFDYTKPDDALAAKSDRDWHVVVFSAELAKRFKAFIDHDYSVAKTANAAGVATHDVTVEPFADPPPVTTDAFTSFVGPVTIDDTMTITPLLTPDAGVYVDAIAKLIAGAKRTFDLQLQYITSFAGAADVKFAALIDALATAQARGVVIRMIFSEFQQSAILELMAEAKLAVDHDHVRIQNNVHNKGMLVDGSTTVVSSQNWSGDGVLHNRDAGLIIENAQVNAYFQARFDYDWTTLATAKPAFASIG